MMLFIIKKHTTGMLFFGRTKAEIDRAYNIYVQEI